MNDHKFQRFRIGQEHIDAIYESPEEGVIIRFKPGKGEELGPMIVKGLRYYRNINAKLHHGGDFPSCVIIHPSPRNNMAKIIKAMEEIGIEVEKFMVQQEEQAK